MQNLVKYPKWQHVITKRIFHIPIKYDPKRDLVCRTKGALNSFKNETSRLSVPVSYQAYKKLKKEIRCIELLAQSSINRLYFSPQYQSMRGFSKTSGRSNEQQSSGGGSENDPKKDPKKLAEEIKIAFKKLFSMILLTYMLIFMLRQMVQNEAVEELKSISWNDFVYHMLAKGEVEGIVVVPMMGKIAVTLHEGAIYKGRRVTGRNFFLTLPDVENFEEKVRKTEENLGIKFDQRVPIVYNRTSEYMTIVMRLIIYGLLGYFIYTLFGKRFSFKGFRVFSQLKQAKFTLVEPFTGKGVLFNDVAGLKEAKTEVMEFVDYLHNPQRYKMLGAKVPKGALLLGPPGCGKTLLAKAVATEAKVPFLSMNGSEFIELFGGLGPARVRDLFKEAKKRAPCIIYIDEIDTIGGQRDKYTELSGDRESERTLNQLLVEMDGMASRENIIILASTNRAEVLDKALLRPGRFDRHILIDLPTLEERKQIYEYHLEHLSLEGAPSQYSQYLAHLTPGFSGADIANVCNEAALHAARDRKKKVDHSDLNYAIDKALSGLAMKNTVVVPKEKRVIAYYEAGYALVTWLLESTGSLLKVTIVPTTKTTAAARILPTEKTFSSKDQLIETKLTKIAYALVKTYGMSSTVGLVSYKLDTPKRSQLHSKRLESIMDAEVRKVIGDVYKKTENILLDNKEKLETIAEELLKKETLFYEDVEKLIGPPPFKKKHFDTQSDMGKTSGVVNSQTRDTKSQSAKETS
ncbi:hypothetical protein KM043_017422 [Ampulex compressa]|nr:hypothetical protein KM043_017422 [Ampulex compressa]